MVLDSDLKQELNLIALSENLTMEEIIHIILVNNVEDYWTELKQRPKASVGFHGGKSE